MVDLLFIANRDSINEGNLKELNQFHVIMLSMSFIKMCSQALEEYDCNGTYKQEQKLISQLSESENNIRNLEKEIENELKMAIESPSLLSDFSPNESKSMTP
jgi:hypothetical protein